MSRHTPPLPFSPYYDFRVLKPVTINGQALKLGDPLPKDAVSPRRLRQMFESRMISPLPPEVLPATPASGATEAGHGDNGDWGANPPAATPARASGPLKAAHKGFGKWHLFDRDGNEVGGPYERAEAERLAAASG